MVPKICSFADCAKPSRATIKGGLCQGHERMHQRGKELQPLGGPANISALIAKYTTKTATGCWEWQRGKCVAGYAKARWKGTSWKVHRLSYTNTHGPIPDGMQIDHMCHNRACVNPDHLRIATPKQNQENRSGAQRNSTTGIRGVSWHKASKRWVATLRHNGKRIELGGFTSIADAERAVVAARLELFTHNDLDRRTA